MHYHFRDWHDWFAWRPVRVHEKLTWLKVVRRRGALIDGVWCWREYADTLPN